MGRLFVPASSQYLNINSAVITSGYPWTLSAWFNSDDATLAQVILMILYDPIATGFYHRIWMHLAGNVAGDPLRGGVSQAGSHYEVTTTTGWTAGVWNHACFVGASATSRSIFLNGGGKATTTVSATPGTMGITHISADWNLGNKFSGMLGEIAVWSVALTDEEVSALAAKVPASEIRPDSIKAYWPLYGIHSPEVDQKANVYPMTLNGSPTRSDHAPVIWRPDWLTSLETLEPAGVGIVGPLLGGRLVKRGVLQGRLVR